MHVTCCDTTTEEVPADHTGLLLNYVAQCCRVTARCVSSALEDVVLDASAGETLTYLQLGRMVKTRLAADLLALHELVDRACKQHASLPDYNQWPTSCNGDEIEVHERRFNCVNNNTNFLNIDEIQATMFKNSINKSRGSIHLDEGMMIDTKENIALERSLCESGMNVVHGLVTLETIKLLLENISSNDILQLTQLMKTLAENSNYIDIASSGDEDLEDEDTLHRSSRAYRVNITVKESATPANPNEHVKCLVAQLVSGLSATTQGNCGKLPSLTNLPACSCNWDPSTSKSIAPLTQLFTSSNITSNAAETIVASNFINDTPIKYQKARSFLQNSVFSDGSKSTSIRSHQGALNDCSAVAVQLADLIASSSITASNSDNLPGNANQPTAPIAGVGVAECVGVTENVLQSVFSSANITGDDASDDGEGVRCIVVTPDGDASDDDDASYATAASSSMNSSGLATPEQAKEVYVKGLVLNRPPPSFLCCLRPPSHHPSRLTLVSLVPVLH